VSSLRRGAAATVAVVMAMTALTACGANSDEFSYTPNSAYDPVDGISLNSSNVLVRDLYLLDAEGAAPAHLRAVLVNPNGPDDALVGATAGDPAVTGRLVGGVAGSVPVPAGQSVKVGEVGGTQITFPGLTARAGSWTTVTLLFRSGKAVTGTALVNNAVSQFSDGTLPTATPEAQLERHEMEAALAGEGAAEGEH
jgi:hypothetical protein